MTRWLLVFLLAATLARAQPPEFQDWLAALRLEAAEKGIRATTLDVALADLAPLSRVIELDRRQPEGRLSFAAYRKAVVSEARIADGKRFGRENAALLREVGRDYKVQPRFVVALWGIETSYGRSTGGFPVIAALATLAHEGRRGPYFRKELLDALAILDQGHIAPARMIGSWAGAMGQVQFMPSSFLRYAIDRDGDGRRDIWTTRADVFASAANYLAGEGWRDDLTWGRAVRLPPGFDRARLGFDKSESLEAWITAGLKRADGGEIPRRGGIEAWVIQPDGPGAAAFLVYGNFRTLLKWNRSTAFALAVGELADRIGDP